MKNPDKPILSETITTQIVPVDLNAYICGNYGMLSYLYSLIQGRFILLSNILKFPFLDSDFEEKSRFYLEKHTTFLKDFTEVFLDKKKSGC